MRMGRVLVLGLTLAGLGCASMRTVSDPASFIAEANPRVVYVTHSSGAVLTIRDPRVQGDSLLGIWQGGARPLSLPLGQVTRVEAVQRDKTRTVLAIGGVAVLAAAVGYMITRESGPSQPCNFDNATQFLGCDNPR